MAKNLVKLKNIAWTSAVIFAGFCFFMVVSMLGLSNGSWDVWELIGLFAFSGSYITGLLIGGKRPLTGGLLSFILPVGSVVTAIILSIQDGQLGDLTFFLTMVLIMMIPGFLYLLVGYLQKKADKKGTVGGS